MKMLQFKLYNTDRSAPFAVVGYLPEFFLEEDPRPAKEQLNDRYAHGGGWHPFSGFNLLDNDVIQYPGDPPYRPLAEAKLHDERLVFYPHAWLRIVQPDGSWEISRVD